MDLGRSLPILIPPAAVAVTALVLLGPGALRPAVGARVRGAPYEGGRVVALRVEGVRSLYSIDDAVPLDAIEVEASAIGQGLSPWRGATGRDGIAEVALAAGAPVRGELVLRIRDRRDPARPRVLAEGVIRLRRAEPAFVQLATIAGTSRGDFSIRVDATRGVLAAPFAERLRVHVTPSGLADPAGSRVDLEISGAGVDVLADVPGAIATQKLAITTDERGAATFRAKPLAHNVELSIQARAAGKTGTWEGTLPIVPGAIWLDPDNANELVSPSPRALAYVSFWSEIGRAGGRVVPLADDGRGFFRGRMDPPPAEGRVLYASVAGDPSETGAATIAWPIRPAEGLASPRKMELLLDGVPQAIERERNRAWGARRAGLFVLGAAALVEMLLILLLSRASQRRLEAHLAAASVRGAREDLDDGGTPAVAPADRATLMAAAKEVPLMTALLLAATVGLAFAMVAALATFR